MRRFSIFSKLSIIALIAFNSTPANAEACSGQLVEYYSEFSGGTLTNISQHLSDTSASQCESQWAGALEQSGVPAEILKETTLSGNTTLLLSEVLNGLRVADQALIKLGRDGRIGSRIAVILANRDVREVDPPQAYTIHNNDVCTLVILPDSHSLLSETGAMAFIMAHELFHCVQKASNINSTGTNQWWTEGSAHWFAHMAQPTNVVERYHQSANIFESDTIDEPLLEFTYSSWPFFAWFAQHRGNAGAVMLLLAGMPERTHSNTDIANLLSPIEWSEFSKQYSAYQIKVTDRVRVNPRPRANLPTTVIRDEDEAEYNFDRRAGKLERYKITLKAGGWELSTTTTGAMHLSEIATSGDPGPSWQKISLSATELQLSVPCEEERSYALVGFGSNPDDGNFTLTIRKTDDSCESTCASLPADRDSCLIGIWEDQNPPDHSNPITIDIDMPPPLETFFSDGSYTSDNPMSLTNKVGPAKIKTTFDIKQIVGKWGTKGNKLVICETTEIVKGTVHTTGPGTDLMTPLDSYKATDPERSSEYTYTCNDTTLTLRTNKIFGLNFGSNLTYKRK